ncbi:uncharacterized protein V1516DRAFT_679763 [Lipomyces oligophaga]|uniref:uncharacterized protein n=1 Tax=Lipomyces oligophaga TaxID=45792 RepID=UPI0034CDA0CE
MAKEAPKIVQQPMDDVAVQPESSSGSASGPETSPISVMISRLAITPIPAWTFSTALLATTPRARSIPGYLPRPLSCVGFSSLIGLGGYMIFDGDPVNGGGFISAWSIMYLMANGQHGFRAIRHPWAAVLSLAAAGNAAMYGKEFFFPDPDALRV